jgi:hypothetical protein
MTSLETIIVGAGPYGLSVGAHLRAANLDHAVIGSPMESWRAHMPGGMVLKSERFASNLSDPDGRYTLERFSASRGISYSPKGVPLPIGQFLDYAGWFQRHAAPDVWDAKLRRLRRIANGFELTLDDRDVVAKRVIVATGHLAFRHFPEALEYLAQDAPELISHSADHSDLTKFASRNVTVIGCGQSALETAALLHEQGANVRVLARAGVVDWNVELDAVKSLYKRLRWPDSGLGDGWRSLAYSELPRLFFLLPEGTRRRIVATANGPSGAWWLKNRVIDKVSLLTGHEIVAAGRRHRAHRDRSCHCGDGLSGRSQPIIVPRPVVTRGDQDVGRRAGARHSLPGKRSGPAFCRLGERTDFRPGHAFRLRRTPCSDNPERAHRIVRAPELQILVPRRPRGPPTEDDQARRPAILTPTLPTRATVACLAARY